jgi:hypothetical protein
MSTSSAIQLLDQALRIKEDMEARRAELHRLGLDVIRLLAESESKSKHARTRAGYSEAKVDHDRFINQMLGLSESANELGEQFRPDHYRTQIEEVLEGLDKAEVDALANAELTSLCERAKDSIQSTPDAVAAALASVYISHFSLAIAHVNTLAAYLQRSSLSTQVLEGAGSLLKAVLLDMGGTVFPLVGTAEVLFQLTTTQMAEDQKRMRSTVEESDRLWFFVDQISALTRSADVAQGSANAAAKIVAEANAGFDEDSRWLVDTLRAAREPGPGAA